MKKPLSSIAAALVCVVLGAVFRLAFRGYGMLADCFFGLALLILAYLGIGVLRRRFKRLGIVLEKILTYGLIIGLVIFFVTEACLVHEARSADGQGDYVVVLGAGVNGTVPSRSLQARLETALEYAEENPEAMFVLSGGQGPGEDISEAECMREWLTRRGVTPDRLILEDKSESTQENIRFSKELLEALPGFDGDVLIITEGYHVLRAQLMALDEGFNGVSARSAYSGLPVLTANYYIREALAVWYYILFK